VGHCHHLTAFSRSISSGRWNTSQKGQDDTSSSSSSSSSSDEEENFADDEARFKADLLDVALGHVGKVGWNRDAIAKGAEEAGLSPSVSSMFEDYDLPHHFVTRCNGELERRLKRQSASEDPTTKDLLSLQKSLQWRIEKVVPFASNYADAVALMTSRPEAAQRSLLLLAGMSDTLAHYCLKDVSADMSWYTKRIGVAGIYMSTELCLVQDRSEGFSETWKFLERRCSDFERLGLTAPGSIASSSSALPAFLNAGFISVMNIFGKNSPR